MNSSQIIDSLGGTSKVAALCEVTESAVSQWRLEGIPRARIMYLRLAEPEKFSEIDRQAVPEQTGDE